jgi:hypothetical protein
MAAVSVPLVAVCCVCRQVTDAPAASSQKRSRWIAMEAYLEAHQLQPEDVRLSHTYCPTCYRRQAQAWRVPSRKPSRRAA